MRWITCEEAPIHHNNKYAGKCEDIYMTMEYVDGNWYTSHMEDCGTSTLRKLNYKREYFWLEEETK